MTRPKISAYIIDDEQHCIDSLLALLNRHCPEIDVLQTFDSSKGGLLAIKKSPPDLLFLDVEMPWMNGVELLTVIGEIDFQVIFTTAHDKYAIEAFRLSAIDYLLKPINREELVNSVHRSSRFLTQGLSENIQHLQHNMASQSHLHRVGIPTREGIDFILIEDIIYCEADSNYAHIYLKDRSHLLMSRPLKELELQLKPYNFCRIHQSHLINLNHLIKYVRGNAGYVVMLNDVHLNVSRSKKQELLSRLGFD